MVVGVAGAVAHGLELGDRQARLHLFFESFAAHLLLSLRLLDRHELEVVFVTLGLVFFITRTMFRFIT